MTETTLRRYTTLPSLIHMLKYRQLTLLDPSSWDDKNDSHFLSLYREKRKLKSVLALCFAQASETYHHWRVFAPGSSGVCLQFDGDAVKTAVSCIPGATMKPVEYLTLPEIRKSKIKAARLPFLKRFAFKPENEVRILWESKTEKRSAVAVSVELAAVQRITLSPWLHPSLAGEVTALLRTIDGCSKLKVFRSQLISNDEWMQCGGSAS